MSEAISATKCPLKMMKNAFYFTVKALFVLEIFQFQVWIFGNAGKRIDKKTRKGKFQN